MAKDVLVKRLLDRSETAGILMLKQLLHQLKGDGKRPAAVFVAGVQRSGTNMMMDVLERSLETKVFHERDARAFDNYQMRERSVIEKLYQRCKARHFVIKSLCELQELQSLMAAFTPAKTLWCFRRYPDVVNSMRVSFRNQAQQVQRVVCDPNSDDWRGRGMSAETLAQLRSLVRPDLDDTNACALQWYFRNVLFFEQHFDANPAVQLICYEDLVQWPHPAFEAAFRFLDIPYSPRVTSKVFATSIRKSEAPRLQADIQSLCEGLYDRLYLTYERQRRW